MSLLKRLYSSCKPKFMISKQNSIGWGTDTWLHPNENLLCTWLSYQAVEYAKTTPHPISFNRLWLGRGNWELIFLGTLIYTRKLDEIDLYYGQLAAVCKDSWLTSSGFKSFLSLLKCLPWVAKLLVVPRVATIYLQENINIFVGTWKRKNEWRS